MDGLSIELDRIAMDDPQSIHNRSMHKVQCKRRPLVFSNHWPESTPQQPTTGGVADDECVRGPSPSRSVAQQRSRAGARRGRQAGKAAAAMAPDPKLLYYVKNVLADRPPGRCVAL